jgi:2-polyprenyl-6-methoxyphenol hydroxylase-like FAD-dependent oxidoreductase
MPEGNNRATTHWGDVLRTQFQGWDRTVAEAIDAIAEEGYYRDDIYYRPPVRQLVWRNVALVGDAAHPFTPDLGQGGCQAIEDAVTLGECLRRSGRPHQALLDYQRARLGRVRKVARDSRVIGQLMASRNPLVGSTRIRHALLAWERPIAAARRLNLRRIARHASRQAFLSSLEATATLKP